MSVLIKGMEVPESCSECRFFVDAWCYAFDAEDWRNAYNKPPDGERLKDCPLEEPKTGKWTKRVTINDVDFAYCSECKQPILHGHASPLWDFCPYCGADMRGGKDDERS